jgi:hypothetical protein
LRRGGGGPLERGMSLGRELSEGLVYCGCSAGDVILRWSMKMVGLVEMFAAHFTSRELVQQWVILSLNSFQKLIHCCPRQASAYIINLKSMEQVY